MSPRNQKDEIRRKAANLWSRKGYSSTGIQELAVATKHGKGALYHHIGSKEQLLYEISVSGVAELVDEARELFDLHDTAADRIRALGRLQMRKLAEDLPSWRVFYHEGYLLNGKLRKGVNSYREEYEGIWRQIITDGVAAGELEMHDPVAVKGVIGMFNYAYIWLQSDGRMLPEEIADVFTDIVLGGMSVKRPKAKRQKPQPRS